MALLQRNNAFSRERKANNFFSLIEHDDNARCKGNDAADADEMFAYCVRSPGRVPSIASQQALMQFGSEHLQFDRNGSANIYPGSRQACRPATLTMRPESPYNLPGHFTRTRMPSANDEPQLELPLPLPARQSSRLAPALLLRVAGRSRGDRRHSAPGSSRR